MRQKMIKTINKLTLALVLLFGLQTAFAQNEFPMPTDADYPKIKESASKTSDFIPAGWKILGEAKGDLNGDKIADVAVVLQGTNPKFISKNDSLGTETFDTNARLLIVLFGGKDCYKLIEQSKTAVASSDSPTMEEPFDSVEIKNGVLQLEQHIFMSAGGWTTSRHTYKFRYQNAGFAVIGADIVSVQRNTGEMEDRSYNFLTRKVKIGKGSIENDKTKNTTRNLKSAKMQTLKSFPKAFEWEVEKDFYI